MSNSPPVHEAVDGEVRLNLLPGSGEVQNADVSQAVTEQGATPCCRDRNHRKLAICSIICGLSCIGIKALIYSVKVSNYISLLPLCGEKKGSESKAAHFKFLQKNYTLENVIIAAAIRDCAP